MGEIKTMREMLNAHREQNSKVEIRTISGKEYGGHVGSVEEEYFYLREHPTVCIAIDKIESITKKIG